MSLERLRAEMLAQDLSERLGRDFTVRQEPNGKWLCLRGEVSQPELGPQWVDYVFHWPRCDSDDAVFVFVHATNSRYYCYIGDSDVTGETAC